MKNWILGTVGFVLVCGGLLLQVPGVEGQKLAGRLAAVVGLYVLVGLWKRTDK